MFCSVLDDLVRFVFGARRQAERITLRININSPGIERYIVRGARYVWTLNGSWHLIKTDVTASSELGRAAGRGGFGGYVGCL